MEFPTNPINSPKLNANDGIVYSAKQFSDNLTLDLTDSEIQQAWQIIVGIRNKYRQRFAYKFNDMSSYASVSHAAEEAAKMIDQMEDELIDTLATRMDLIATVDMTPVFEGESPIIELIGALPTHSSAKYGLDHDRKEFEVKKAKELGEDYHGQKQSTNTQNKRQATIENMKKSSKSSKKKQTG